MKATSLCALPLLAIAFFSACATPIPESDQNPSGSSRESTAVPGDIVIMLDPGHGGHNTGAPSYSDVPEKLLNNQLCAAIAIALVRRGFRIAYTRRPGQDLFVSTLRRAEMANVLRPDLFLSIHHNRDLYSSETRGYSFHYSSYRPGLDESGTYITVAGQIYEDFVGESTLNNLTYAFYRDQGKLEVVNLFRSEFFVYDRSPCPVAVASGRIAYALADAFGKLDFIEPARKGAVEEKDFVVLRKTQVPSVMIEAGYISNADEERLVSDPVNRQAMAEAVATALTHYFLDPDRLASSGAATKR